MKNKKVTFALIVSVAAVWGIIFYRIFAASAEDDPLPRPVVHQANSYESLDDYLVKDTFKLVLNYRDPFLDKEDPKPDTTTITPKTVSSAGFNPVRISTHKKFINWDIVKYTGHITNPESKKMVCILTVNGKEYMLSEGQSADGVKLIKSGRDSVKVLYRDKMKFIKQQ